MIIKYYLGSLYMRLDSNKTYSDPCEYNEQYKRFKHMFGTTSQTLPSKCLTYSDMMMTMMGHEITTFMAFAHLEQLPFLKMVYPCFSPSDVPFSLNCGRDVVGLGKCNVIDDEIVFFDVVRDDVGKMVYTWYTMSLVRAR